MCYLYLVYSLALNYCKKYSVYSAEYSIQLSVKIVIFGEKNLLTKLLKHKVVFKCLYLPIPIHTFPLVSVLRASAES